jgi:hypothetical protein
MYQIHVFFMVTDPKTTVRPRLGQCVVVFLVAFVETRLRLREVLYALIILGPIAMLVQIMTDSRKTAA